MILRPLFEKGSMRKSHFTFVRVLIAFPPQIYHPPNFIAHYGIRVLTSCHVPHGGEENLIGYEYSAYEGEVTVSPRYHFTF